MTSYLRQSQSAKNRFLRFTNADGKAWIVPIKNMRTALNLYQPSGARGKLLKRLLPWLHFVPQVRRVIKAESLQVELDDSIRELLTRVLGLENFEFSVFEGTPSIHKKVTIQISQGQKIVAYCKLSDSADIAGLFYREQQILEQLRGQGIANIPHCLYCGPIEEGSATVIFVQSTIKTNSSKVVHTWTAEHSEFLEALHDKTKVRLPFAQSDFAQSLVTLEGYLPSLPSEDGQVIARAIARVREHYGHGEVEFSAFHADFTPWNMFFEKGRLFVFDFEYSGMSYPPHLDWFHYFTQTAIFERHLSAKEIVAEFSAAQDTYVSSVGYDSYLLDIISKYISREGGALSPQMRESIAFWCDLLNRK